MSDEEWEEIPDELDEALSGIGRALRPVLRSLLTEEAWDRIPEEAYVKSDSR